MIFPWALGSQASREGGSGKGQHQQKNSFGHAAACWLLISISTPVIQGGGAGIAGPEEVN